MSSLYIPVTTLMIDQWKRVELNKAGEHRGYSHCGRCIDSFLWKPNHCTRFTETDGCFPLCEECWKALTPAERLPFYRAMFESNLATCPPLYRDEYEAKWPLTKKAVEEGK
jgi:hypothetical protein